MDDINYKKLVADLAVQFYDQGWFPGSGGSLTIRKGKKRKEDWEPWGRGGYRGGGGTDIILHKDCKNFIQFNKYYL
jgi:hypothetical protein